MLFIEWAAVGFMELPAMLFIEWVSMPLIVEPAPFMVLDVILFVCIELVVIMEPPIMFPAWEESSASTVSGRVKARAANDSFSLMFFFI